AESGPLIHNSESFLHCEHVVDRQIRVDLRNRPTHVGSETCRRDAGTHHNVRIPPGKLHVWGVEMNAGFLLERAVLHVADDANDLHGIVSGGVKRRIASEADSFADRIFIRPELAGRTLADDDNGRCADPIAILKSAPTQERYSECLEMIGPNIVSPNHDS